MSELLWAADRPLGESDRAGVAAWLAAFCTHVAGFALEDASPALPLGSFAVPTAVTARDHTLSTGIPEGTRIGTESPRLSVREGHIESFGRLGAP